MRKRQLRAWAALLQGFCGLGAMTVASAQDAPDFLIGDWNVNSAYTLDGGEVEQDAAVASAIEETIAGTTTWIRHTLVGMREGRDVEVTATFARNPADSQWVMMQADSVAGTADIAVGAPNVAGDEWTFTSFPATRPDGGLDRFHYANITADGYTLTVSRSFDGGATWEAFWTQTAERAAMPVLPSPLPGPGTCTQAEYGQFDFWLGDWDLVSTSGQSSGDRSRVTLATGDCVVEETFLPVTGGGASRSMYDARTGEWARVWLEPGRMLIFVAGGLENGDMIMVGGTTGSSQLSNRTVWEPRADGSVRQFTQTSSDNGATWVSSGFDAVYVVRGSTPPPTPSPPPADSGGGGGSAGWIELLWLALLGGLRAMKYSSGAFRNPNTRGSRIAIVTALALAGCGGSSGGSPGGTSDSAEPYAYQAPDSLDDGWEVGDAASENVSLDRLTSMMNDVHRNGHDDFVRNILVVKNGRLVFEEYFATVRRNDRSHLQSATKSIVAAIFGLAVAEGYVASLDDPLFAYFPEYQQFAGEGKDAIRVHHVLSMTPGFDWNENSAPIFGTENDNIAAYRSGNYIGYVLQKDLVSDPGADWNYNSGCPMLLAGIIRNQTGVHLDEFAAQRFFGPLGIDNVFWEHQADGLPLATGGLWLRARDAAKIGQAFLDGGRWLGEQVLPESWVDASLTEHIAVDSRRGYGYLWWTDERRSRRIWYAAGYGGQVIVLVPSLSATIVINADYTRDADETGRRSAAVWGLIDTYILPAL